MRTPCGTCDGYTTLDASWHRQGCPADPAQRPSEMVIECGQGACVAGACDVHRSPEAVPECGDTYTDRNDEHHTSVCTLPKGHQPAYEHEQRCKGGEIVATWTGPSWAEASDVEAYAREHDEQQRTGQAAPNAYEKTRDAYQARIGNARPHYCPAEEGHCSWHDHELCPACLRKERDALKACTTKPEVPTLYDAVMAYATAREGSSDQDACRRAGEALHAVIDREVERRISQRSDYPRIEELETALRSCLQMCGECGTFATWSSRETSQHAYRPTACDSCKVRLEGETYPDGRLVGKLVYGEWQRLTRNIELTRIYAGSAVARPETPTPEPTMNTKERGSP